MPTDASFTDMYKAGVLPDFEENGNHAEIPQLQDDNEVYEEYYDDVPSWEEDDDEDFEVQRSAVSLPIRWLAYCVET